MKNFKPFLFILVGVLLATFVVAAQKYRIENGTNQWIYEHGTCKNVANASGYPIMVPTHTSAGWTSFYSNSHASVTISNPTCAAASSVACGATVTNECGVSCGYTGTNNCVSYSWQTSAWSGCSWIASCGLCSAYCGGGTQNCTYYCSGDSRSVWCQRNDGVTVADSFCDAGTKPATNQPCTCSGSQPADYSNPCHTDPCPRCVDVDATCKSGAPAGTFRFNYPGGGCGGTNACNGSGAVSTTNCGDCPCAPCTP